ncbi:MAG TPA: DUF4956 domain-containing protein [Gemmatimonadales bacterium]|nr:DUF4956 domain-containing protein [Gemmatimonadales bacterium]
MESSRAKSPSWFSYHPVIQIFVYYLALAAAIAILQQVAPNLQGVFNMERFQEAVATGKKDMLQNAESMVNTTPARVAFEAVVAMMGAVLLMIPVAWVYILTRAKKGFSQSTVQTLIFLPIVVAGLIMLVRTSVALAFGLGGVVGAVSFRNRLEDPKDAIYIFLAIAVGLASGVQVASAALAISLFYNIVVLMAWKFDFGRMPAALEQSVIQKRLDRVKQTAQPEEFLSLVDKQLLKSMTPDQLQAISQRAAERGRKAAASFDVDSAGSAADEEAAKPKFDSLLRLMMQPDDAAAVRQAVEPILEGQTKRWEFEKAGPGDGGRAMAQYKVKFKRSIPSTLVVEAMRRAVLPKVVTIDVRDA